jgi:hypothetical protein
MWAKKKDLSNVLKDLDKFVVYIMETVEEQTNALTELGEINIILRNMIKVQDRRIQQLEEANGWSSGEATRDAEEFVHLVPDNNNIH